MTILVTGANGQLGNEMRIRHYLHCVITHSLLFLIFVLLSQTLSAKTIIHITSQNEFDRLTQIINESLTNGNNDILIVVNEGVYVFSENAVNLINLDYPNADISIVSNRAIIKSKTEQCTTPSDPQGIYLSQHDEYDSPWTSIQQTTDTVKIVDRGKGLCSIPNSFDILPDKNPQNKYIQVSCWFSTTICPISQITRDRIYFNAGDFCKYRSESTYHINMDYSYAKTYPRVRFFGISPQSQDMKRCTTSNFMLISNCRFKRLCISGFSFVGSNYKNSFIKIYYSHAQSFDIEDNRFNSIGGTVLDDVRSENVHFIKNSVVNYYGYGVKSENGSKGFVVRGNTFKNGTLRWVNQYAICTQGEDFIISDNTINNFMYGGISSGVWHGSREMTPCTGIIEKNEVFYSGDYLLNPLKYTLMDSGAIYTWTQSNGIIICNNYIHDIDGVIDNRGIFCDDGTKNVTVADNVILRIHNSYCIDLRNCPNVADHIPDHNTGNHCSDNVIDGRVRFFVKDSSCTESGNISFEDKKYKKTKANKTWKRKIKNTKSKY